MSRPSLWQRLRYRVWALSLDPRVLDASLLLAGTLKRIGWQLSAGQRLAVDRVGQPLPWFSYPAIYWLESVLRGTERVFEYGAGHSTLWFSRRVASVTSVEHDSRWHDRLLSLVPDNVRLVAASCAGDRVSAPPGDAYVSTIECHGAGELDVVVVDGRARLSCLAAAPPYLSVGGLVVLDDGQRPDLRPGVETLRDAGFQRLDFTGLRPGATNFATTTVFCRDFTPWLRDPRPAKVWGRQIGGHAP